MMKLAREGVVIFTAKRQITRRWFMEHSGKYDIIYMSGFEQDISRVSPANE